MCGLSTINTFLRVDAINAKAKEWEHEGFKVKANVGGWDRPDVVEGLIPDIRGKRDREIRLGFVDFDENIGDNRVNMNRLLENLKKSESTSLRFYNVCDDGTCKLIRIAL
jgi:hypothetical protein